LPDWWTIFSCSEIPVIFRSETYEIKTIFTRRHDADAVQHDFAGELFPARGQFAAGIDQVSVGMIALLFFMHGARLSREAVIAGLFHWRLHCWC
jgi:hypothetical protein